MAIYHLSVKTISRSAGRSATAAAAYRCGVAIADERTGQTFDYRRRQGVELSALLLPAAAPSWAAERAALWNSAEASETRRNSTVAREFEIALPAELDAEQRQQLALRFSREIVERHGCAADVAIHAPGRGDDRNHHAHILLTTRRLVANGFGEKTRELDDRKTGLVSEWRERWAQLANEALSAAGQDARIDHRTLAAQGIAREPSPHLGPKASGYEARTGLPSNVRQLREAANAPRAALDASIQSAQADVIELEAQLDALKREQRQQQRQAAQLERYLAHDHALARLPLVPTVAELAQHLRHWPEPNLRELVLKQVRQGPLSIPTTDERREAARLQQVQREQERERSALRVSAAALREERDQRQHRPWILRLFDHRLPQVLEQIEAVERRCDALRAERRATHAAVLKAQSAAEAADNAARASALAALEAVIERAVQSADAPLPSDSPPQELARAAPAPATPEPHRILRHR